MGSLTRYENAVVTVATAKTFSDGNTSHSFQTSATGQTWLRGGKNAFDGIMVKGNNVNISTEEYRTKSGSVNTNLVSAELAGGASQQRNSTAAAPPKSTGAYEASTQSCIEYQSSRKDAIELVKMLVGSTSVKLGKNPTRVIELLVDKYTATFYTDIRKLGAVSRQDTEATDSKPDAYASDETDEDS